MNTANIQRPLPPARTESPHGTLDERIALAEKRLVSREEAVRHSARALLQRTQDATSPSRLLRPAGYALGAVALLWGVGRLLRPRREAKRPDFKAAPPPMPASRPASRFAEMPWMGAANLLWPHLPSAWRGRMGPDGASILVALGVPLAGLLFKKRTHGDRNTPPKND